MEKKLSININSFNVRGIGGENKRLAIFSWLKRNRQGIHFLQETHSTELNAKRWSREWGGITKFCHGEPNSRGVAILIDQNIDINILETISDNTGRLLVIRCVLNDTPYVLINVYCPTKDNENLQKCFLEFIDETLQKYSDNNIIMGGDFNTYLNVDLDKKGGKIEKTSSYANNLKLILNSYNMIDIWRIRHPMLERYTRRENSRSGLVQSRLDYIFVSRPLEYTIENTQINPSIRSDHSIVSIQLKFLKLQQRGRGYWKMNTKYLKDNFFLEIIKNCINNAKNYAKTSQIDVGSGNMLSVV